MRFMEQTVRGVTFRGDADFSQTRQLDRWDRAGHRFVFKIAAMPNFLAIAEGVSAE